MDAIGVMIINTNMTQLTIFCFFRVFIVNLLETAHFPCIAHLSYPDHYIVISEIETENESLHIFDDGGVRTRISRENFEKRWTGYTLHIRKNEALLKKQSIKNSPVIGFEYLMLDKGDIPAIGEPTEFIFPVYNLGLKELIIEDIKVSCGCLKSVKPTSPIPR